MPIHTAAADLAARWRPTDTQIHEAVAALAAGPAEATDAFVPLALPGKQRGWWEVGQLVEPVPGVWLADRTAWDGPLSYSAAREAADQAGADQLAGRPGVSGYATIDRAGVWHVWEGIAAERAAAGGEVAGQG